MTQLAGQNSAGWTSVAGDNPQNGGNAVYFASGYVSVPGVITAIHVGISNPTLSATKATVYVYQGVGPGATFVAMSNEFDITLAGMKIVPCLGTVAKGSITLVLQPNTGFFNSTVNNGSSIFVCNQNTNAAGHMPYRSPPPVIPAADVAASGQEFLIWADGTPPGNGILIGPPFGGLANNDPNAPLPALVQLSNAKLLTTQLVDPINQIAIASELSTAVVSTGALITPTGAIVPGP